MTLRHARLIWLVALLLAVPAVWRTASLYANLRSELEHLLPKKAPSVAAIEELRARLPGLQHLGVVVEVGDAENLPAGERFLDDLAAKIETYPPELVRSVRVSNDSERRFLEQHAPLYLDLPDLVRVRERVEARRDWEVAKATDQLLDEDEAPPPLDFRDIEAKYRAKTGAGERVPRGRFSNKELAHTLLVVDVAPFSTGQGRGAELLRRVKADVASLGGPASYAAGMRVGYAGDIAISVEETEALKDDLSLSSVVVLVLVGCALLVYFRWYRSILALIPPLLLATAYTFALASLPPFSVTELNSNTAFLGSIIVGNGINYGVILLARFTEERRQGVGLENAVTIAVWGASPGTLSASLAASAAYGSLSLTEFRGFRQFGYIGLIGMVMSWAVSFVLIPSLTVWLDRDGGSARSPSRTTGLLMGKVAAAVMRWPRAILALGAVLTLASIFQLSRVGENNLEYDFSKLRRADTWVDGEGHWGRKMDAVLGSYLTPTVLLADSPAQARAVRERLERAMQRAPLSGMVTRVFAIDDVVPNQQEAKIAEAKQIRSALTPRVRARIPADRREQVDRLLSHELTRPIGPDDLPPRLLVGLRERDGQVGNTVVVFPRPSRELWQGPPLAAFVGALRAAADTGTPPARVAGSLPLSTDILASVRRDGVFASFAAFAGVFLVVFGVFRFSRTTLLVMGTLTVGVVWVGAFAMAAGVKVNFANFIAFPITFGIGVDYATNVMSRYLADGARDVRPAIRATGGAVALCSVTTVVGYSSLLLAENRALFLFGLLAVLGEVVCLIAGILLLPALLLVLPKMRAAQAD
jgi:predicted RND superfamily exporter protein